MSLIIDCKSQTDRGLSLENGQSLEGIDEVALKLFQAYENLRSIQTSLKSENLRDRKTIIVTTLGSLPLGSGMISVTFPILIGGLIGACSAQLLIKCCRLIERECCGSLFEERVVMSMVALFFSAISTVYCVAETSLFQDGYTHVLSPILTTKVGWIALAVSAIVLLGGFYRHHSVKQQREVVNKRLKQQKKSVLEEIHRLEMEILTAFHHSKLNSRSRALVGALTPDGLQDRLRQLTQADEKIKRILSIKYQELPAQQYLEESNVIRVEVDVPSTRLNLFKLQGIIEGLLWQANNWRERIAKESDEEMILERERLIDFHEKAFESLHQCDLIVE